MRYALCVCCCLSVGTAGEAQLQTELDATVGAALDAVFSNLALSNRICGGDGAGGFVSCGVVPGPADSSMGVTLGFVDGDSNLDAVFANLGSANRVCLGDGAGSFLCQDISSDANNTSGVALGLVNDDSALDAVFANNVSLVGQPNRVCLGDGAGGFACADTSGDFDESHAVALGFFDGDSNLDAVFANLHANRVCLGDGSGSFSCQDVNPADPRSGRDVAVAHIDGDSNLDLVFAGPNRVCLGNGDASFSCQDVSRDGPNGSDLALGHVDGDSNLDAVFVNPSDLHVTCLGDGNGGFSCQSLGMGNATDVALGFLDTDANLDAVFAVQGAPSRACLGDGTGDFPSCSDVSDDALLSRGVALGEFGTFDFFIFADGFESGDASAWSVTVP